MMATGGAGDLSTTAIETCIVGWADETQDGDEIPAARAELAALLAEAGRATAPTVWLGVDPPLNEDERAMVYDPTVPGRIRLHLAILWLGELRAEAGRGAAGARDETAALVRRALVDWCGRYGTEVPTTADEAEGLIDDWLPGWLDALRAGGAGGEAETEG